MFTYTEIKLEMKRNIENAIYEGDTINKKFLKKYKKENDKKTFLQKVAKTCIANLNLHYAVPFYVYETAFYDVLSEIEVILNWKNS